MAEQLQEVLRRPHERRAAPEQLVWALCQRRADATGYRREDAPARPREVRAGHLRRALLCLHDEHHVGGSASTRSADVAPKRRAAQPGGSSETAHPRARAGARVARRRAAVGVSRPPAIATIVGAGNSCDPACAAIGIPAATVLATVTPLAERPRASPRAAWLP